MALSRGMMQAVFLESVELPTPLFWYDVAGQTLFPIMCTPNSFSSRSIAYLVKTWAEGMYDLGTGGLKKEHDGEWFGVLIDPQDGEAEIKTKIEVAIGALIG